MPKKVSLGLDQLVEQSESSPLLDRTKSLDQTFYESDSEDLSIPKTTTKTTSLTQNQYHNFKVPANPSPSKRPKFRRLNLDLDDENSDEQDDEWENFDYRNQMLIGGCSKTQTMLASQQMSQLSQVHSQLGCFTYFPRDDCLRRRVAEFCIDSENLSTLKLNPSFFKSARNSFNCHLNLLIETVNQNEYHFQRPNSVCIEFLRYYLRLYKRLTNSKYSQYSEQILEQYLGFVGGFFRKTIFNYKWKRSDVMLLFFDPRNEAQNEDFLFDLIDFIIKQLCRLSITDQSNLIEPNQQSSLFDTNFSLKLPFKLLQIIVDYLSQDFGHFILNSDNYSFDISNMVGEFKPICVRLIWHDRRPEYICSTLKYFISYLVKIVRLNQVVMYSELIRLFSLFAESLRIGTGNIRPYCEVNSSKIQIVPELYNQLEKHSLVESPHIIRTILTHMEPYPWLVCQFSLHCLSKQYIDLNRYLNQQKFSLSLRLICDTFLVGDITKYRYFFGQRQHSKRLEQLNKLSEQQKQHQKMKLQKAAKKAEENPKSEASPQQPEVVRKSKRVRKQKRTFEITENVSPKRCGGNVKKPIGRLIEPDTNALHDVCRRGDILSITSKLLEAYNPNGTDSEGFTSLSIAARFRHTGCIRKLIQISKDSEAGGVQLDFETGNKLDGSTPLHYTIESGDETGTMLLLQSGGRHLLQIERFSDWKTPLDLVSSSEMSLMIDSVDYSGSVGQNLLPRSTMELDYEKDNELSMDHLNGNPIEEFKNQCRSRDGRPELVLIVEMNEKFDIFIDSSKARFYCDLVSRLIRHYLYTMKMVPFLVAARRHIPKQQQKASIGDRFEDYYDEEQTRKLRQCYSRIFTRVFQRNSTESDIDHLLDDTLLVQRLPLLFDQFMKLFDIYPNIDQYKIEEPKRLGSVISKQFDWIQKEFGLC